MIANTADTLSRGMTILSEKMGIVEAERFIFLIKNEGFDYTKWHRERFGNMTKAEVDEEMERYFSANPYQGDPEKII